VNSDSRLGLLAFGDSITNGGGELQWGVALQSWAPWTARGLGLALTNFAVDGARVTDVVSVQLSAARERSARPDARYDLGALHIGVNDVRSLDWDPEAFAADLHTVLAYLAERCDRIVVLTIPLDLGRPRAGAKVEVANATIEAAAAEVGATIVDLRGFRGRKVLMPDHVHPTALGQIAIADRVVEVLEEKQMKLFVGPSDLVTYETTKINRLRGDLTYTYRHAKVSARALRIRVLGR
jgi:lysophospholipase L1-like esterase